MTKPSFAIINTTYVKVDSDFADVIAARANGVRTRTKIVRLYMYYTIVFYFTPFMNKK